MDKRYKSYEESIEELSLMLMYLTRQQDNNEFCRYRELSWKGYDFKTLENLDNNQLIYQPRSKRGFDKYLYLSEEGRDKAQVLLQEYGFTDKETGKIAGFLNGLATDEYSFRDEFFTDATLHNPSGKNVMLLGLDVLPAYRKQGLAKEIVFQYLRKEWERNRKMVILTCLDSKVKMYKKMGFQDQGKANSSWGSEEWHEMSYVLNI